MSSSGPAPTIDIHHPHRSALGRLIECLPSPRPLKLDKMKHVDALPPEVRKAGEFLLESIEDTAELNKMGRWMVKSIYEEAIQNHLQVAQRLASQPHAEIRRPVFVLGLPRTGSTYLFNMLGATGAFRTMTHWESQKVASRKPDFLRRFEADLMLKVMHRLAPGFRTIHEILLDGPEECTRPVMNCFVTQSLPGIFHIPAYNDYLDTADYRPTYDFFYKQLQVMGAQGKRWLLKSPIHIQAVDTILEVFPDARFVHLHRNYEEVVCSICSLVATYRCMTSHRQNGPEIGEQVHQYLSRDLAKCKAVLDAQPDKVLNLDFTRIVDAPVDTVRQVFEFAGEDFTAEDEASVRGEMGRSVRNKYGKHIYREEDYFPQGLQ